MNERPGLTVVTDLLVLRRLVRHLSPIGSVPEARPGSAQNCRSGRGSDCEHCREHGPALHRIPKGENTFGSSFKPSVDQGERCHFDNTGGP
jgi:hypothetical protein